MARPHIHGLGRKPESPSASECRLQNVGQSGESSLSFLEGGLQTKPVSPRLSDWNRKHPGKEVALAPEAPVAHHEVLFPRQAARSPLGGWGGDGGGWSAANVHHMYLQPHVGIVSTRENCADMQNCTTACQLLDTARETRRTEACSCAYVYLRNVGLVTSSVYHLLEPSQPTCQARTVLSSVLPTAKNNPSGLPMQGLQEGFLLLCLVWGPSPPTSLEGRSSTFCLYNPQCTVSMQENVCGINE